MALRVHENEISSFSRNTDLLHRRPMMLKDFLRDESTPSSSNGFPMYHRKKPCKSTAANIVLLRSWSKKAAATKISAIVKLLQFASLKSPRKLTRRRKEEDDIFVSEVKVKVKDILRWRSFRDVVEVKSTPLDLSSSPDRSTTAAATTTTTTSSCSKRSSWCDSDFTAEELPPSGGENEEFWGKNATTLRRNSKEDWQFEESDQKSPVSVLDSPFTQVEDFIYPFLANIQRVECNTSRNHEHHLEGVDAVEEKANQLLRYVKEGIKIHEDDEVMILEFFMHELSINGKLQSDSEILRIARSWINDEFDESFEWEVEKKRASYVEDMEKGMCWKNFNQEQEEVSMELGFEVLDDLIDHLLIDFIVR